MSHIAVIEVEIKDLDCLKKAAQELGLEFREGQKNYRWFGRSVGDYPLPQGFTENDLGKCEHAIAIPNSGAYEVGITPRRDGKAGYTLLWDFWAGGHGLQSKIGEGGHKLIQEYSVQVAMKQARKMGYRNIHRTLDQKGNVVLQGVR